MPLLPKVSPVVVLGRSRVYLALGAAEGDASCAGGRGQNVWFWFTLRVPRWAVGDPLPVGTALACRCSHVQGYGLARVGFRVRSAGCWRRRRRGSRSRRG